MQSYKLLSTKLQIVTFFARFENEWNRVESFFQVDTPPFCGYLRIKKNLPAETKKPTLIKLVEIKISPLASYNTLKQ